MTETSMPGNGTLGIGKCVGAVFEEENERPSRELRMAFAADQLRMKPGQTREVVLLVKPPQMAPVAVDFMVTSGLLNIAGNRELAAGAAQLKSRLLAGGRRALDKL